MSGWVDRAVGAAKSAETAAEIAFTIAGSAMAPAANTPASYQTSNPTETAVVATAEMIGAKVDGEKISDDMDLEGVQEAEYSDTSPPADDSTFGADEAADEADGGVVGEGDAFAADDTPAAAEAAEGDGDAFASDGGDLGDLADDGDTDGDVGDGDAGSDGDAGDDGDGGP